MQRPQHIRRHVAAATTHKASAPTCGVVGGSGPSSVGALVTRSLAGVRGDGGGLGGKVSSRVSPTWKASPKWYPNFSAATVVSDSKGCPESSAALLHEKAISEAVLQYDLVK